MDTGVLRHSLFVMTISQTTELQAVNIMLSTIGESPVNTLSGAGLPQEAVVARTVLHETSVSVQSEGWNFNTQRHVRLVPDTEGYLIAPSNCVQIVQTEPKPSPQITLRGTKVFNLSEGSYFFRTPIYADMVLLLDFNELPQTARQYVTTKASRSFQQRFVGSQTLDAYTQEAELKARYELLSYETREGNWNMLDGSFTMTGMLKR